MGIIFPFLFALAAYAMTTGQSHDFSFGPWHSAYGYATWRFPLAMALLLFGLVAGLWHLFRRPAIWLLMVYAGVSIIAQTALKPAPVPLGTPQHQTAAISGSATTSWLSGGVVFGMVFYGSILLAWLHLGFFPDPRPQPGRCAACGYDLAGLPSNTSRCPECGTGEAPEAAL
jgi:hypothetical protein